MEPSLRTISWVAFAVTMYLVFQGAVKPWILLPDLGNIGFTLVFVFFALTHCVAREGLRRTGIFFAVSAVVSYALEETGVRSGLIYGAYHYSDLLGPKLGHVPVIIPLAWFMMIYPSWMVTQSLLGGAPRPSLAGISAHAAVAALVMTAWDLVMDPGMAMDGNWTWEHGGAYFGVPLHNYAGWLLTTFFVYWIAGWLRRNLPLRPVRGNGYEALPVILYAALALRYVANNRYPALQLIAVFSMGVPALISVLRLLPLRSSRSAAVSGAAA